MSLPPKDWGWGPSMLKVSSVAGDGEYTPAGGLIRNPWGASIRIHCDALSMERLPARETVSRSLGAAFRVFAFIGPLLDRLSAMPV